MVTFLDIGILNYFSIIFPALLVFAVVFALLKTTKILGENDMINALVSIALGFMVLLSDDIVEIINYMAPWFVLVFIFLVLLLMIYRMMGVTEQTIGNFISTDRPVKWAILGIAIVIFLAALGNVVGEKVGPYLGAQENVTTEDIQSGVATGSWSQNVGATLFHPKILGLILVMMVAVFTIAILGMKPDY